MDEEFATLLSQSSKLIKQAALFLKSDDNADQKQITTREKCLQAIISSNDAMLGVSEKLLEMEKDNGKNKKVDKHHVCPSRNFTFDNIIGSQEAKLALYENIVLPLSMTSVDRRKIFQGVLSGGGNVLLYGPPGTGKTCLAQAAACEADAQLFAIRPSEILSKYQGESEKYISNLFEEAKKCLRAVIFFDEFDSIATARGGKVEACSMHRRLLAELLLQLSLHSQQYSSSPAQSPTNSHCSSRPLLSNGTPQQDSPKQSVSQVTSNNENAPHNGFGSGESNSLVVVAATNRLGDLDEAVIRRFDAKGWFCTACPPILWRKVLLRGKFPSHQLPWLPLSMIVDVPLSFYVGVPDKSSRIEMASYFMRSINSRVSEQGFTRVADYTIGWSGSEIQTLCREAAMIPLREVISQSMINAGGHGCHTKRKRSISAESIRPVSIEDFDAAHESLVREPLDPSIAEMEQLDKAQHSPRSAL